MVGLRFLYILKTILRNVLLLRVFTNKVKNKKGTLYGEIKTMNPAWMDKKKTGEKAGFAAVFPDFTRRDEKSPKDL